MRGDWRDWRPSIWLAMLGIAVALLVNPPYVAAIFWGAAIGIALRTWQQRRRAAAAASRLDRDGGSGGPHRERRKRAP